MQHAPDPAPAAPLLMVSGLSVTIATPAGPLHAVRDISFDIRRGETVCLVGESGCGKSMTALAIMGLLPRSAKRHASRLEFAGQNLSTAPAKALARLRGDRMAMIFQEPMTALNPAWTIGEQLIEVHRRHKRQGHAAARARAIDLLGRVGIADPAGRLGQYPHQLSGGLRQRVMIAMALMCEPDLLVADEPTTALDVTIQAQILRLLADLQRELGIALLLITHDLGVVARVADRVNVMYAGTIVESAAAAELFASPRHPYTRGLIACLPKSGQAGSRGQPLGTIPGVVPSLVGATAGCAFRSRCGEAIAACALDVPTRWPNPSHRVACHTVAGVTQGAG